MASTLQGSIYPARLDAGTDLTGSTVTLTVTAPDGSTSTPPVTPSGQAATAPVNAALVGVYLLVWTVSGAAAGVVQDQFTVEAPRPDLISLADLQDSLHLGGADAGKVGRLREYLRAATGVIENVTGPIVPAPRTYMVPGAPPLIVLPDQRVARITSVVETAGTTTSTLLELALGAPGVGYTWDRTTNILRRVNGWGGGRFASAVTVNYVAGMATIPPDVQLAAVRLIGHWWRKNETPFRGTAFGGSTDDGMNMPGNYMVPNEVMELLEPLRRAPSVA